MSSTTPSTNSGSGCNPPTIWSTNPPRRSLLARFAVSIAALVGIATGSLQAQNLPGERAMATDQRGDNGRQTAAMISDGWTDLFNGRDLTNWVARIPDGWGVEDGELVARTPGTGTWLRTKRMYRDFELAIDFWMPKGGNSGLALRGSSGGDPAFTGFELQMYDTHGQEPGFGTCGAIYNAVAPASMAVRPAGQWNTYRVRLLGDTLDVWLNDAHIHDAVKLDDRGFFRSQDSTLPLNTRATTGYIALQNYGHPFRYRNIRIRDLSPDPEPRGMTHLLTTMATDDAGHAVPAGWFQEDAGTWTIEDGALVGRGGPGHLFTNATYTDFEMRALVKINTRGNSGMYFRVRPNPDPNTPWPIGYEAQVDNHDMGNYTGCVYNMARPTYITAPITRDNAWFDYRVRVEGDHIRTWINGVPMVNAVLDDYDSGHLAVQGHHDGSVVMYKDIRVLRLE